MTDFKLTPGVVYLKGYQAAAGERKYLVAHGDYTSDNSSTTGSEVAIPRLSVLEKVVISSAPQTGGGSTHLLLVIAASSLLPLLYL